MRLEKEKKSRNVTQGPQTVTRGYKSDSRYKQEPDAIGELIKREIIEKYTNKAQLDEFKKEMSERLKGKRDKYE